MAIFALMTLIIAGLNRFMRHQIGLKEARQKFLIAAAAIYTTGHATTFASPSRLILSWQRLSVLPSRDQGSAYDSVRHRNLTSNRGITNHALILALQAHNFLNTNNFGSQMQGDACVISWSQKGKSLKSTSEEINEFNGACK